MIPRTRTRLGGSLLLALVVTLLTVSAAAAAKPLREPFPAPDGIVDTSCGYPILVTFPVQRQHATTFFNAAGEPIRFSVTGRLVVTLTNTATRESLTANISGPGQTDLRTGAFFGTGHWATRIGSIPLALASGRINVIAGTLTGHVHLDICEALAP